MAAEQGYAIAQNNLGWMYQEGKGVQQDDAEAVKWYRKAAEQGNAEAQYRLERRNISITNQTERSNMNTMKSFSKKKEIPFTEIVKRFAVGNTDTHCQRGMKFQIGTFFQYDVKFAKEFQKAAEQGHIEAQYMLGLLYLLGKGVPESRYEATKWLRKAAEQGHSDARDLLAKILCEKP